MEINKKFNFMIKKFHHLNSTLEYLIEKDAPKDLIDNLGMSSLDEMLNVQEELLKFKNSEEYQQLKDKYMIEEKRFQSLAKKSNQIL